MIPWYVKYAKKQKFTLNSNVIFYVILEYAIHYQLCPWRERSDTRVEIVNRERD